MSEKEIEEMRKQIDETTKNGDNTLALFMLLFMSFAIFPHDCENTKMKEDIAELKGKMSIIEKIL